MNTKKIVGVDTHKDTLACYCEGKFKEFSTTEVGFKQAVNWAGSNVVYAVEGAYCFGQPFVAHLIKNGCEVYEVNPLLTKSWRNSISIFNPKNDYGDAKVISLYAHNAHLEKVSLSTIELKSKLTLRKSFVKQKVQITNQIKMYATTFGIELPYKNLTTQKAIKWLLSSDNTIFKLNGKILLEVLNGIKQIETEIETLLPDKAKKLTKLEGISSINASIIYTETKGILKSPAALANYAGIAPIEISSGRTSRKRVNKKGNRILNSVLYSLSIQQIRYNEKARIYYEKKLKEGKTPRRARKAVARNLINIIFKILTSNDLSYS